MNTKHLKAKILDLAIRGKLVPQDLSEGNAADLLKEHNNIPEDEIPFEIPENWCWWRLDTIFDFIGGGTPDKSKKEFWNGDISWASVKDIKGHYLNKTIDTITKKGLIAGSSLCNKNEIILVTRISPGKAIITNIETAINQDLKIARLKFQLNKEYLRYCFNYFEEQMYHDASGSTVMGVKIDYLNAFLFPLPPLSEQQRIVSAIEKAFEQIDIIEKNKLNLKTYIKQTKSKVLDLAIHGKIVEQNPGEGNAFELLEKIRNEKVELVKQKKIKEDKKSSFIIKSEDGKHYEQFADGSLKDIEDEIPFEIPENWCWVRLRDIGIYKKGPFGSALTKAMFVPKSDSTIKVYEQQNAIKKNHELGHYYIKRDYFESNMKGFEVHPGDIIVSCAGTIGKTYILPENIEKGIINQALMKMTITNELSVQFFLMYFDHILKTASDDSGKGTAMKNIPPFDIFKQFLFPLPPLLEQERIVKKIDQIFEQLDILEKSLGE